MPDETFDPAQRLRQRENPGALDEAARERDIADLDADHAAETLHLSSREVVLRVGTHARVVHALDSGMLLEPFGDPPAVRIVLAHAQRQRFGAAQCQPAVEWTGHRTRRILDEAEPFGDIVAPGDEHA